MTEPYNKREQTEVKHFILRRYLQTLTFKLLQGGRNELAYVDGFSGPWESRTADYSDTSFMIAINVLKDAHAKFKQDGQPKTIKCFFSEANPKAYAQLAAAVAAHNDPENGFFIETFEGRFEDAVPNILKFIGSSFALVFIDPTGWTGYPYETIKPVLRHRPSEVLINFMYDHINRFAASDDPTIIASLDPILGGAGWGDRLDKSMPRGLAVEKLFRSVLAKEGDFEFVLSTRIDKATADRPHFFLAYGSRVPNGVDAFRDTEFSALKGYEKRRVDAKQQKVTERTRTADLFAGVAMPEPTTLDDLIAATKKDAAAWAVAYIKERNGVRFKALWTAMLQAFMLRVTDAKSVCVKLAEDGVIENTWKKDGKRTPHDQHVITLKAAVPAQGTKARSAPSDEKT